VLIEPNETPYDLRFYLFGTPVRVHPLFWLVTVILGWPGGNDRDQISHIVLWVVAVFVSILLHEFGHIWAGRAFGSDGYIVLYSFGGLAVHANDVRRRWQRVAVSLAGPLSQIALIWLPLRLWLRSASPETLRDLPDRAVDIIDMLLWINLYWPLLNLLPVWPLDGGMVAREFCDWLSPRNGLRWSLIVSALTAGALAINSLAATRGVELIPYVPAGGMYSVVLFGLLAIDSVRLLNLVRDTQPWRYEEADDRMPWER
jgi:Zn-dependent protease